jgi:hypothetical protein
VNQFGARSIFRNGESYLKYVSKLENQSRLRDMLFLFPRQAIKPQWNFIRDFKRIFHASRLNSEEIPAVGKLPEIEIFVACIAKDFELLPVVLEYAVLNSRNRITKITVATTPDLLETELEVGSIRASFIDENSLVSEKNRDILRAKFGSRYGWVLQQLLALTFVMNSVSEGVLVINADTILTRKQVWLNEKFEQPLMCSYEYNSLYYEFLDIYGFPIQKYRCSHITHHMLMQPTKLRSIYAHFIKKSMDDFIADIVKFSNMHISPVCVEFELYAYGMLGLHADLVKKKKFANTNVRRSELNLNSSAHLTKNSYNSISLHDYIL